MASKCVVYNTEKKLAYHQQLVSPGLVSNFDLRFEPTAIFLPVCVVQFHKDILNFDKLSLWRRFHECWNLHCLNFWDAHEYTLKTHQPTISNPIY